MKKLFILILLVSSFNLIYGCEKKKDYSIYIETVKTSTTQKLDEEAIEYDSVSVTYNQDKTINKYIFYDLIITVSGQEIPSIYRIATFINNLTFNNIPDDANIIVMKYVKQEDILYQINSSDEFQLQTNSFDLVYDSIKVKCGINLTNKEKARIYKELNYYYTKYENGSYKYTEQEAETIVAEKYNVSTEFLKNEIWTISTWEYYDLYYNHHR